MEEYSSATLMDTYMMLGKLMDNMSSFMNYDYHVLETEYDNIEKELSRRGDLETFLMLYNLRE